VRIARTAALFVLLAASGVLSARKPPVDPRFAAKLSKDDQVLHALDRLTFGPRPGDEALLRRIGLKKWLDQQLHPERIRENPVLAEHLAPLDSIGMSSDELVLHYPNPQFARAVMNGKAQYPTDPLARLAVQNMIDRFQAKQGDDTAAAAVIDEPNVERLRDILGDDGVRTLRNGTTDQKRAVLAGLSPETLRQIAQALPPRMRGGLLGIATPTVRRTLLAVNAPQQAVTADLIEARLYRAIYSNRQLEELLTDFWFNHFNVFLDKGGDRYLIGDYERDAIRPHVLGHFRDLLEATATSPAMLFYLDNWESQGTNSEAAVRARGKKRGLNENYGRELMELHTLGVDGGYTQQDVTEVARCFTGWTLKNPEQGGGFFYNDKWHDKGEKTVLGVRIPAGGGINDGERVLDIIAKSPATAHHISYQLAQKFVADNPPPSLVERMSKTFLKSNGDLRKVMKTMLESPEFWSAGAYRAKVKTPFEMVVSAVRATDADVSDAWALMNQLNRLGEPLYRKLEPTGYSNVNADWVSTASLLDRMNFALALARNNVAGVRIDPARFGPQSPDEIARELLARDASDQTRAAIDKALAGLQQNKKPADGQLIAGLVLGSPDFQRR